MQIKNFKIIGDPGCGIKIDDIVVLVGSNNVGKSTLLDAYEVFASSGKELDESYFHNHDSSKAIEIIGVFDCISDEDENVVGKKWKHVDTEFGECIKIKWIWNRPGEKAKKQSFDPSIADYVDGGVGGWDSLIQSRIPQPIRLKPTEPVETTQIKIVEILKEFVKSKLKSDNSSTKSIIDEIDRLTKGLFEESKAAFDEVASKINRNVSEVFPGTKIELVPKSKEAIDEKIIGAESYLKIGSSGSLSTPLIQQGTGIQRALLWSALSVMSDNSTGKKKIKASADGSKILLIDEPEAFLHPPTIRSARESLYNFALNNEEWQVLATTHSPVFIDLSKDHTTIVRVDGTSDTQRYVSTDKISFTGDERTRLQMIRSCNPIVNEFFFYENIFLVEGPTEQIVLKHFASIEGIDIHVINCYGKANIPLFCRILNQFKVPYTVIHDSDTPKVKRKGKYISAAMWKTNEEIRKAVLESSEPKTYVQFQNFEREFLDEDLQSGKVDRVLEVLKEATTEEYKRIQEIYIRILQKDPRVFTTTEDSFELKKIKYIEKNSLNKDSNWF